MDHDADLRAAGPGSPILKRKAPSDEIWECADSVLNAYANMPSLTVSTNPFDEDEQADFHDGCAALLDTVDNGADTGISATDFSGLGFSSQLTDDFVRGLVRHGALMIVHKRRKPPSPSASEPYDPQAAAEEAGKVRVIAADGELAARTRNIADLLELKESEQSSYQARVDAVLPERNATTEPPPTSAAAVATDGGPALHAVSEGFGPPQYVEQPSLFPQNGRLFPQTGGAPPQQQRGRGLMKPLVMPGGAAALFQPHSGYTRMTSSYREHGLNRFADSAPPPAPPAPTPAPQPAPKPYYMESTTPGGGSSGVLGIPASGSRMGTAPDAAAAALQAVPEIVTQSVARALNANEARREQGPKARQDALKSVAAGESAAIGIAIPPSVEGSFTFFAQSEATIRPFLPPGQATVYGILRALLDGKLDSWRLGVQNTYFVEIHPHVWPLLALGRYIDPRLFRKLHGTDVTRLATLITSADGLLKAPSEADLKKVVTSTSWGYEKRSTAESACTHVLERQKLKDITMVQIYGQGHDAAFQDDRDAVQRLVTGTKIDESMDVHAVFLKRDNALRDHTRGVLAMHGASAAMFSSKVDFQRAAAAAVRAAARDPIKQHRVLSFGQLDGPEYLHGDAFYHLIVEPTERGERADMEDAARQLAKQARLKRAAQAQVGGAKQ